MCETNNNNNISPAKLYALSSTDCPKIAADNEKKSGWVIQWMGFEGGNEGRKEHQSVAFCNSRVV